MTIEILQKRRTIALKQTSQIRIKRKSGRDKKNDCQTE